MPSVSEAQQAVAGAALSVRRGEKKLSELPAGLRAEVKGFLRSAKTSTLEDFARTKVKPPSRQIGGGSRTQIRNVRSA